MRTHELVYAACVLECLPSVEVLSVRVGWDRFYVDRDRVPVVELDVHAKGWAQAQVLADSLGLVELEGHESDGYHHGDVTQWRTWTGWAADASHEAAVWVEVTAAETVTFVQGVPGQEAA